MYKIVLQLYMRFASNNSKIDSHTDSVVLKHRKYIISAINDIAKIVYTNETY